MLKEITVLEASVAGCTAEVWLNDAPVAHVGGADFSDEISGAPVEQYLLNGENSLRLVVNPGPTPSVALLRYEERDVDAATASAKLVRYPSGTLAGGPQGVTVAEVNWTPAKSGEAEWFALVAGTAFTLDGERELWAWQKTESITLDAETLASVRAFIVGARIYIRDSRITRRRPSSPGGGAFKA
jgi:hypothetical protein